ncbi:MAG: TrkA family potassium uptake protein [Lentisphaerae bacterium]|jgi:trk system potassium uptake protein|nr:TrkA family potassium uptake protein [Lentisphaerota bacterium]MBT4818407.1 TrkA family potassium uptake protein [Lentisphaerota bacterium]MBT5610685.1 TrkA family potassium uptake protein [Lentisphaerota bacterium]MBT7058041.1 TrkA family potassium uptake protein [Lentisphaerota bacterium]MBT7840663.1 TrkA family potassium uptake protein [Lentisphaerota bacterium]
MVARVVVIGLGIFGREVALSLTKRGFSVMAIDSSPDLIEDIKDVVAQAVVADTTDESALYEAKVDEASVVINAIGTRHIENSILTTALLRQLQVPRIVARAVNDLHARILRQVGASEVINPEQDMGRKLAHQIARPGLRDVLSLSDGFCVAEIPVPPSFVGRSLSELEVKGRYSVNVVGVQRAKLAPDLDSDDDEQGGTAGRLLDETRRFILDVDPKQDTFLGDDTLVVIGREEDVNRLTGLG